MQHFQLGNQQSSHEAQTCRAPTRCRGIRERFFVGMVLLTLVHTSEALAGEQGPLPVNPAKPDFDGARQPTALSLPMTRIPQPYLAVDLPTDKIFSPRDFRPRGHSLTQTMASADEPNDAPMMHGTTVWQRLSDYRSRDRVRVVTLWETGGSSVSLQAGKRGDPSLQWTSRWMNRGGATRGLLDEFLTSSLSGFGRGLHLGSHGSVADVAAKPMKALDANLAGAAAPK
jgi:hypothetical protein